MRVVLSDTSPLRYLVLIGEADVLAKLYGRVVIPTAVANELSQARTPEIVRRWIATPPSWIDILRAPAGIPTVQGLDDGERDAIALAIQLKADLVLMDDREAVHEATRLGLTVTGTLGVLEVAAEKRLVDLPDVLTRLRATNFRASNALFDSLLKRHAEQQ
jgi:predicted nucleic acid-binding protein